jgi:hypothetical protein
MGAARIRRAVLDPLARARDDGLTRGDIHCAAAVSDAEDAFEDDSVFVEFWRLAWLNPTAGTLHAGDTNLVMAGVHSTNKFVDELWFVSRSGDPRRLRNKLRHSSIMVGFGLHPEEQLDGIDLFSAGEG